MTRWKCHCNDEDDEDDSQPEPGWGELGRCLTVRLTMDNWWAFFIFFPYTYSLSMTIGRQSHYHIDDDQILPLQWRGLWVAVMLTTTGELFYIYYFPTLTFDRRPDGSATATTRTMRIAASQSSGPRHWWAFFIFFPYTFSWSMTIGSQQQQHLAGRAITISTTTIG